MTDATRRFSNRVENYIKYRPTYPPDVIDLLARECGLTSDSVVADVGSGTGILSEMFLRNGNRVYGVEPNREMREAGERLLRDYANFKSIDASAEATTLADASVDFIIAGQAFHWFDMQRARREFARISKPRGWVVLVWNDRLMDASPFLVAYERLLLDYGTDYAAVNHRQIDATAIGCFFGAGEFKLKKFHNRQVFDFESLRGRLLSSSYTPEVGHTNFAPMLDALRTIFDAHQADGVVAFEYETLVYYGQLPKNAR
ncbi:MAG TPA: methyltransferase domain-containing protein [Pyrinomonadaceae bacterium]|jgi:SAM-dependent methyltransferase